MSYEYKELIEQAIIDDDRPLDWEEGFKELDEVYAKAQAYDECVKALSIVKVSANPRDLMQAYDDIGKVLEPYVFESGNQ